MRRSPPREEGLGGGSLSAIVAALMALAAVSGFCLARWILNERDGERRRRRAREVLGRTEEASRLGRLPGFAFLGRLRAKKAAIARKAEIEKHVPEMVDALALGMGAGLSFESAFKLYCSRFEDPLAKACDEASKSWESGLVSREDALRTLAAQEDVPILSRLVANILRCLRFGSPMLRVLEVLASESRSCYRARMEERVAKAPVKMLVPTTALILPAMLILVMAPVLLDAA